MKYLLSFLGSLLIIFSGCQHTESAPVTQQHPSSYRSFAIAAASTDGPASDPAAAIRLAKPIEDTIISTLTAKGYTQAPSADADLLVKLSASFSQDALINSEKRSMVIDIVDRRTNKRVWMDKIERSSSNTLPPEMLQKEIARRLASFPEASVMNNR